MQARVTEVWSEYRGAVDDLYPPAEGRALLVDPDSNRLDALVEQSERVRALLFELLAANRGDEREELETAAYAAAAIDVRIGADVLVAFFPEEGPEQGFEVPGALEEGPPLEDEEALSMADLLAGADRAFGLDQAIGGAEAGDAYAPARAEQAIDELVEAGAEGAGSFAGGIFSAGVMAGASGLFEALNGLDWLRERANEIGGRLKRGLKLIELGLRKLAATVGVGQLVELASDLLLIPLENFIWQPVEPVGERAVRWAVRSSRASQTTASALRLRDAPPSPGKFDAALRKLCNGFAGNMRWAKRINWGLAIAVPVLGALTAGVAPGAVLGVLCVGVVVCLCNLADRLDTLPGLDWVPGVPSIAANCR